MGRKHHLKRGIQLAAAITAITLSGFSIYLYRTLQLGREDGLTAFLENLNPGGEFLGPEGIQFGPQGNIYVGDAQGLIWQFALGAKPAIYARMSEVAPDLGSDRASDPSKIHIGGMAFDAEGNLYACAYDFANGSILRVDAGTRRPRIFARDIGVANYLIITEDKRHLWVSDYRSGGRVLRFPLDKPFPALPDQIVPGLVKPNGLALGKDDNILYAAETNSGNVVRINLGSSQPEVSPIINLKGSFAAASLDGLAFDPRDKDRRFLYVAENLRGAFTVVDVQAQPARIVKRIRMALMGGRPCPASLVIRDGYLYFTDLWTANPIRIVLRFPKLHNHAFRFPVNDLSVLH